MHRPTSLEAETRRSKGWQGRCLLTAGREKLLQSPPLASGAFWALFGVLGLEMHLCLHLHVAFSPCACLHPNVPILQR